MARKNMIAGNWKMHASHLEAIQMVQKLSYRLDPGDYDRVDVVVAPPFTALRSVQTVIEVDHLPMGLAAQNVHWEEKGAFTGEISPVMLSKLGVNLVIVGHSERRQVFGEPDEWIRLKVRTVFDHAMTPIVCLGETLEEREAGSTEHRVAAQLEAALDGITPEEAARMVVAYEPIWAIGTGRNAAPDDAAAVIDYLREKLRDGWGDAADETRILYGGSVNPGNIAAFMAKEGIDGALVGGASLEPDSFASIIRYWM